MIWLIHSAEMPQCTWDTLSACGIRIDLQAVLAPQCNEFYVVGPGGKETLAMRLFGNVRQFHHCLPLVIWQSLLIGFMVITRDCLDDICLTA
jgi:hypothetical protein